MDASESSYCSFCKHTRPIDEFGVKQNGRRMKLCKRCSEYHQTRRLRIAAAKVVAKAESSALAIADLKRRRASTVTMDDRRASPYTPHPTPVAPVPKQQQHHHLQHRSCKRSLTFKTTQLQRYGLRQGY